MATRRALALTLALMLCLAPAWLAQAAGKAPVGKAAAGAATVSDGFDLAKVETIAATVTAMTIIPAKASNGYVGPGMRLAVQTPTETLDVPLGPKWYLDRQPVKLALGDQIELRGVRPNAKTPLFLVSEIKKEKSVAAWRDADGNLYWKKSRVVEAPATPMPAPPPKKTD